jgi:hypothetical protein
MIVSPTFQEQLFPLGQVVATPGVLDRIDDTRVFLRLLKRHATGDWGDLDADDRERNDVAVQEGMRVFSAYVLSDHRDSNAGTFRVWVITEWDRSATTFLLPSEY